MKSYEIERKYLIETIPFDLNTYSYNNIEQGYLCTTDPVIRIRKKENVLLKDKKIEYFMTYKSKGFMVREEYNLPLSKESYEKLKEKIEGSMIVKRRYNIPYGKYKIELDVFSVPKSNLILAEVEFESEEDANSFIAPAWFGAEVTNTKDYQNSTLCQLK